MFGKHPAGRSLTVKSREVHSPSRISLAWRRAQQLGKRDYAEELALYSDSRLEKLIERRRRLVAALVLGLFATLVVWVVALSFPYAISTLYSFGLNSDVPRLDSLLKILLLSIPFAPPFVSVFALSNLLFPSAPDTNIAVGLMSSFDYREKSNRRTLIIVVAAIAGGLNCLVMLVALLSATGK